MAWMEGKVDMACCPGVLVLTGSELFFQGISIRVVLG